MKFECRNPPKGKGKSKSQKGKGGGLKGPYKGKDGGKGKGMEKEMRKIQKVRAKNSICCLTTATNTVIMQPVVQIVIM